MNPRTPPSEPPDTREQPECICPVEGPECPECPAHGLAVWRLQPVYPKPSQLRDKAGTLRIGYKPEEDEDVKF